MNVIVIGGGVAGCESAVRLANNGVKVYLIEKENTVGGKLNNWHTVFPGYMKPQTIRNEFLTRLKHSNIILYLNTEVKHISENGNKFTAVLSDGKELTADKVLITTGYELFDARRKEEYGYGIYENVITSADLEKAFCGNTVSRSVKRAAFIHCVGSRDEKVHNLYCSKLCCITAVKQAVELRKILPEAEIICFYMDMRMFGAGYEEMYREAQEKYDIKFIRGRLSEASENINKQVVVKTEDTLLGKPLKMTLDLMVLMAGIEPGKYVKKISRQLNLNLADSGFIKPLNPHYRSNFTNVSGVYIAGSVSAPMTLAETLADARSAVSMIMEE